MNPYKIIKRIIRKISNYCFDLKDSIVLCFGKKNPSLKDAYSGKFLIGCGIDAAVYCDYDHAAVRLLRREFNSFTSLNCLKASYIQPQKGFFNFSEADKMVRFGERNRMAMVGHNLIWTKKYPLWFFKDDNGKEISREELLARMKTHIQTVMGRYRGRIKYWDVVNEVFLKDGSFTDTPYYRILGENYVKYAFLFAREADPDAVLYINEPLMTYEKKRNAVINLVKKLRDEGIKIDGIGVQCHAHIGFAKQDALEKSIAAIAQTGCKVSISEMGISVVPLFDAKTDAATVLDPAWQQSLNPYPNGLPDKIAQLLYRRYKDFFELFLRHADCIDRVTFWGISDKYSDKNDFPIPGRTDYPLLFDRNYQAKPVVKELINMGKSIK